MKKIYRYFLFFTIFLILLPSRGFSSHIVGGAITYTYNGGSSYTVMLKLYRDCSGIAFPASVVINVRQANGSLFTPSRNFTMPGGAIINIPPVLPPCATSPSVVPCVEERTYTLTVNLPAAPGGMHLYYSICCRNPSISNITTPGSVGETFYTFIPCYFKVWEEDFTLPNGTTTDTGPTAWTRTLGTTPPVSAQVTNGQFEVVGSNSATSTWASQSINISSYASGVNLSVNASRLGTMEAGDSLKIFYAINGGPLTLFPVNGQLLGNFATPAFATATGLIGNTIQIFIRTRHNATSPASEIYNLDMVTVYNNTFVANSSPQYSNLPPLFLCATNTFTLNHSALDADGDLLVYSMYTPYDDAPAPTFPNNSVVLSPVTWVAGYSANSPFNAPAPPVTLNSSTGIMTGVANTIGQFVFGVKVAEYRGGVLLSEMTRDYQMNTVICPPFVPPPPTPSANTPLCVGQTLSFTATTVAGATYTWSGPNGFTANVQNPTLPNVTLLAAGVYSVQAIVAGCTGLTGTISVVVNPTPAAPTASANSPICAGTPLNLTATFTSGATYNWAGPNSFTSNIQNPTITSPATVATGIYSVAVTLNGCVGPFGTFSVTVNAIPTAPTAASNSVICAGQTLSLTANPGGAIYNWTGPNSFTSTLQNPTIAAATTSASGTYSVTQTVLGCTSLAGITNATINPIPAAPVATSNSTICAGQTLSLSATFTTGATYNWAGPNTFTSNIQNPTIVSTTTASGGTYSVSANIGGCSGPSGTVNVTVNPIPATPTAANNSTICVGQTLNLTANPGGAIYSWTGPNGFTSTLQNPTIAGASTLASGNYSVTQTLLGCTSAAGTTTVTVSPLPAAPTAASNSTVCAGQTLSLTASFTTGATYNWTGPNTFTSNLQNPTIVSTTTAASGAYSVNANIAGCSGPSGTVNVTINPIPAAPVATSNSTICAGQTLSLSASFTTGATYNWAGPNTFTSNVQNPTIVSTTTASGGTYSVSANIGGCSGSSGTVNVTVNPIPAAPAATNNSALCAGQTLNLTANPGGAIYSWTGPNGFTSTLQNPTIAGASTLASGTYSVTQTLLGCTSLAGITNATINPIPAAPTAANNSTICAGQTLSLSANPGGAIYSWNGPNGFTSTLQNPTIAGTTTLANGTYSVTQTLLGCTSTAGTTSATIKPIPSAPVAANNSALCAGQTLNLTASFTTGATYSWTGPNGFVSSAQNPVITSVTNLASGIYSVSASVGGCSGPMGTTNVTINPIPAAPTASNNSGICVGQTLSLTANPGGAVYNWTGPNGFTSTAQNPVITSASASAGGTYSVTQTVLGCTSAAGLTTASVSPIPSAPVATSNSSICAGQTLSLSASFTVGATYNWTGPNTFTANVQNPVITLATTSASGIYSVSASVDGCFGPMGTVSVTVKSTPLAPSATNNSTICAGQTLVLNANPSGSIYNWSGPNGFTSTLQNPVISNASTLANGNYSVTQTVLGCTSAAAITGVSITPIPAPPTGNSNSPVCGGLPLVFTLTPSGGTYSWSGPNSFTSTVQNPTISPATALSNGNYSVTTTVFGCTSPVAIISASVGTIPGAPGLSANSPLCVGSTLSLTATFTPGVVYIWNGPNNFTSTTQNPVIVSTSTLATGIYTVNGSINGCNGPVSTITVGVDSPAIVDAGVVKDTICANAGIIPVNGTVTGVGMSSTWSTLGTGTFGNPNNLSTVYNISSSDTTSGIIKLVLSSSGGSCPSVKDTITYIILKAPFIEAGANLNVCKNAYVALNATITGVTSSGIWTSSGTGTFTPTIGSLNGYYIPSSADTALGSIKLTLETTNNKGCISRKDSLIVTFIPSPKANFVSTNACATKPLSFTNMSVPSASIASYTWDFGDGTGTSSLANPTYTYAVGNTYTVQHIVTLQNGCKDTIRKPVTVFISPLANFTASNVCAGNQSIFLDSSSVNTGSLVSWNWNFGDGGTDTLANPTHLYTNTGTFPVSFTVISSNGCATSTVKNVVVRPRPLAQFGMSATTIVAYDNVSFTDQSTATAPAVINTWSWDFGNTITSTLQNPTASWTDKGVYSVMLAIRDNFGCADTVRKDIVVTLLPMVPTAFTPNGDGSNDFLFVKGGPFVKMSFRVYNNWGELLFNTDDQEKGWDGKYKGQPVPLGVYVWILDVDLYNGQSVRKTGDITILK